MQGWLYSSDQRMPDRDLRDLADALAIQLHNMLGARVFRLHRSDVMELLDPYICDLEPADQDTLAWIVWHLFQDAYEITSTTERRKR